jgi:hypothetical protein
MIQQKNFLRIANNAIARATNQNDTIIQLELNLIEIDYEIFTATVDLDSAQIVAERAIAFDPNYKNDTQRKSALQFKLNQDEYLTKRQTLQQLKSRKAQTEARLGAAKRLFQLALIQAQSGDENV